MTVGVCDCAVRGIPEGLICGNPHCPRVQACENAMRRALLEAFKIAPPKPQEPK